ncbi:hypothetical protein [Vibrio sp. THAF190c]|uniref:hypothetical protein n=1 Tax=Vibrio sp. THAF190c TaxID=2587865 RepID=UPI0012685EF9|nr:hypothetical protein [Vibrio sp. THAF190c]QFT13560.1 hypothetical protein FIV04_26755 [Vibrio sp. THAF190c]
MKLRNLFSLIPLTAALSVSAAGPVSTNVTVKNVIPASETNWSMNVVIDQYAAMRYNSKTKKFSPNLYSYDIESTFESAVITYGLDITLVDEGFSCIDGPESSDIIDFVVETDYEIVLNGQQMGLNDTVSLTNLSTSGLTGKTSGKISVAATKDLSGLSGAYCRGHASFLVEASI